ncbi:MAG TPA: type II secretion system protein GspG [Gemmatimonadales bacterium]|nr:type II secretion system protein GspG [Gemmatimonadales bacterium]
MTDRPKRSWPLFVVAGCSFLPGFGIFFGAIAAVWGLVSDRPRALLAAGVGATGAFLNLAGSAAVMIRMRHDPVIQAAEADVTQQDLVRLVTHLEAYHHRTGDYPPSLLTLVGTPIPTRLINIYDHSGSLLAAPHPYQYVLAPDHQSYDLFSAGPDGKPGSRDDIRPILPDSVQLHSGYRPRLSSSPNQEP